MKTTTKAVIAAVLAAGVVTMFTGCGSDKFEGDWSNEVDISENTLLNKDKSFNAFSPSLVQVHIEKKGDGYVVTQSDYHYTLNKQVNKDKKSGLTYQFPCNSTRLIWLQVNGKYQDKKARPGETVMLDDEAAVIDYTFTLRKKMDIMNAPATAADKGTVLAVKANQMIDIPFNYIEQDKTLVIPVGAFGDKVVLKKTNKDTLKDYMDTFKTKAKEIIASQDQAVKDIIANNKATGSMGVSGDITFNDKIANK